MDPSIKQRSIHVVNHDSQENVQLHQDRDDNQPIMSAKTTFYRHQVQHTNSSHNDNNNGNSPLPSTVQSPAISISKGEDRTVLSEKRVRFVADVDDRHDSSKRLSQNNHIKLAADVSIEGNLASNIKVDGQSADKATNTASTLCNGGHNRHDLSSSSASPSSPLPNPSSSHSGILLAHEVHDANWLHQAHHHEMLQVTCHDQTAEFYKSKFITGNRGKCIKMQDKWYTPVEFEMACGITSSKDWRRNITYAGHPLHQLIRAGIIAVHVVSTQNAIHGPCPLFIPFKRKHDASANASNDEEDDDESSDHMAKQTTNRVETMTMTSSTMPAPTVTGSLASGYPVMTAPHEMAMVTSTTTIPSSAPSLSNLNNPTHNLGIPILPPLHSIRPFPAMTVNENNQFALANTLTAEQYMLLKMEETVNSLVVVSSQLKSMIDQMKFLTGFTNNQYIDSVNLNVRQPYMGRRGETGLQPRANNRAFKQKEPSEP